MDYNMLNGMNLSQLQELKNILNTEEGCKLLLEEIDRRIPYKELGLKEFSSRRLYNYKEENEEKYLEIIKNIRINSLQFLCSSLSDRTVNTYTIWRFREEDKYSLFYLENFYKDPYNTYHREGGFNTYNYIKDYIYGLLLSNSNISVSDVFYQYDEKMKLVSYNIAEVAAYLYEYMKNVDGIKFSVGRQGLANTARRVNRNAPLSPYQEKLVQAVAFGTSYEKLESRDYEHAKRLLFIP